MSSAPVRNVMKILFTGGSSFTGYWFIRRLVESGHDVVATFRREKLGYAGVRAERVSQVIQLCETRFCEPLQQVIQSATSWDLWCQHAAEVTDYKSPAFDPIPALTRNCEGLVTALEQLRQRGCQRVLLTGSYFEQREGGGDCAVSSYGLSKGLTADIYAHYTMRHEMHMARFVIPNPFGPLEEKRLTHYLVSEWMQGKTPRVAHPDYVRDNIHVSLLANAYERFAQQLPAIPGRSDFRPSGYVGTQRAFVELFAREMGARLGLDAAVEYAKQQDFSEPMSRMNSDALDNDALGWNEARAWDDLASYYGRQHALQS